MHRLLRAFTDTGVDRGKIERFLDAEPKRGAGTVRDHVAAEMANQLLGALGQAATQDPEKTRRLREIGNWRNYDQRPEE